MATNIPPHNLAEIIDGTVALIHNPDLTDTELQRYIPGPDFPTGGHISVETVFRKLTPPAAVLLPCGESPPLKPSNKGEDPIEMLLSSPNCPSNQ